MRCGIIRVVHFHSFDLRGAVEKQFTFLFEMTELMTPTPHFLRCAPQYGLAALLCGVPLAAQAAPRDAAGKAASNFRETTLRGAAAQDAYAVADSVRIVIAQAPPAATEDESVSPVAPSASTPSTLEDEPQTLPGEAVALRDSYVEAGLSSHKLSDGFGSWSSIYARTQYRINERNSMNAEIERSREFGDSGTYVALGGTHVINDDWYASLTMGTSSGGFYLPRFRADAFLNRKLLRQRNLVATVGLGYYRAKDEHKDQSLYLGATYYFAPRWIVESGVRFNRSNPGSIGSRSQFIALTNGEEKKRYITVRVGSGRESYQLIGPNTELVDFGSNEASLTWREWISKSSGLNLVLERYKNPSYKRRGVSLGYFQDF
jgi:YaiO family outer membrane protein